MDEKYFEPTSTPDSINNSEEVIFPSVKPKLLAIGWNSEEYDYLSEVTRDLASTPGVAKVWLYGSMARGNFDEQPGKVSDIDVAAEVNRASYRGNLGRHDLSSPGKRPVQINYFPQGYDEEFAAWSDEKVRGDSMRRQIRQLSRQRLRDQIILWKA